MIAVHELKQHVGTSRACQLLGVPRASFYRCTSLARSVKAKGTRSHRRALSDREKSEVKAVLYSERFVDKSPYQVFAAILDEGKYLCSVRTMYRILAEDKASRERRNQLRHPNYVKPELLATGPNQVWSWDITKLLGPQKWTYYYLYVILDIYSRCVVGWMLAHREAQDLAARLIRETIDTQNVREDELTLHSDRGPSMTSHHVAQLLATLGVTKSHSRPHVSNDNPFSESQFKTLKYRPEFPARFGSHEEALGFCRSFFHWYNHEHYHSGIGLLTPASLHDGHANVILDHRHNVLRDAYEAHPERFIQGPPKAQRVPEAVWINPPLVVPQETKSGLPETHGSQKPAASLTHPRLGYPSSSCVPAELDYVSPSRSKRTDFDHEQQPFEHPSHAQKNPGGLGAGPHSKKEAERSEIHAH